MSARSRPTGKLMMLPVDHRFAWVPASGRRGAMRLALAIALACTALPLAAGAAVSVYASARDDGVPSSAVEVRGGQALVHVWINPGYGGVTGAPCPSAGANEICGWGVSFQTTGNLVIVDVS